MHHRYEAARPAALGAAVEGESIAYLPIGPLEYHGPHLPLGTDPLIAEGIAHLAADRTGGVVLPTLYLGAGALPLPFTVTHSVDLVRAVVDPILDQLAGHGFGVVVVVSGHGALDHLHTLREACDALTERPDGPVGVMAMWNELTAHVDGDIHDHGARVETSYLLALRPELVDLDALDPDPAAVHIGVYGANPRHTADVTWGETLVGAAVDRLVERVGAAASGSGVDNWADFRVLVQRLQAGPLDLVEGSLVAMDGGLAFRISHGGAQSKYLTAFEVSIDGRLVDGARVGIVNDHPGESAVPRRASDLGPLSGTYLRRGQTLRVEVDGVVPVGGSVEVVVDAVLAGVVATGAKGILSRTRMA